MPETSEPAPPSTITRPPFPSLSDRARSWGLTGLPVVIAAAAAALAALLYVRSPGVLRPIFDDAYISLTFARNLAEHGKLSFDGQHWSTGATSVLHVALLALSIKLGVAPFSASIAVGVASHIALAVAVYWLGWAIFRSRVAALAGALIIAFMNYTALDAGNGMETILFMALVTATLASFLTLRSPRGRLITGVLLALAILTRPEGIFLLPAVLIYLWLDRPENADWRQVLREGALLTLPALVALAGLELLSLSVNGSLAPGTASVKLKFFQDNRLPLTKKLSISGDYIGLFLGPLIALILLASLEVRRRETILLALFWLPFITFYVLLFPGGLSHYFYRYQHPVLPLLAALAGGGAFYLIGLARSNGLLVKLLVVAGLALAVVPIWQNFETWRLIYRDASYETLVDLEGMARDLNTIVRPDETLATHDIGAIGYYAEFKVLDLVGLVNPDVIPFHDKRTVLRYIEGARPDYLLIFPEWDADFLHIYPGDAPRNFELVKVYPGGHVRQLQPYVLYRIHYPLEP